MTVYVDKSRNKFGRMVMCHMIADTPDELVGMANKIGVSLKWFQRRASVPHFDIAQTKRTLALEHGAVELGRRDFVAAMRRIRQTWPVGVNGEWRLLAGKALPLWPIGWINRGVIEFEPGREPGTIEHGKLVYVIRDGSR